MQDIAFDVEVIDSILSNSTSVDSISKLMRISQYLKEYHRIIDSISESDISFWQESINKIKQKFKGHEFIQFLDFLFGPVNLRFAPVKSNYKDDKFYYHIKQSPDKIGITERDIDFDNQYFIYSSNEFISNNFNNRNNLFRLTKVINYKKGDEFYPQVFYPYLRKAKKIEYADKYLFAEASELDNKIILSIIDECKALNEMIIYSELNIPEIKLAFKKATFKSFKKTLKKHSPKIDLEEMKQYNSHDNHDRFLIVDNDKYSITFTTSTNNLEIKGDKLFVKKPFKIVFSKCRDYID